MQDLRFTWLPFLFAAGLAAQTLQTIRLPNATPTSGESAIPLASSPSRYQQWYSANDLRLGARTPMRIRSLAFLASNVLQNGSTVDIEIRMAHLSPSQSPSSTFNNNLAIDNTLVVPRGVVALAMRPIAGARVFTFNFLREFAWNGSSGIVIDMKVFGNGNGNNSYLYPCQITTFAPGQTMRLFASGPPASLSQATTVQSGVGLLTEFDYVEGVTVSFGTGCPGSMGVPIASTSGGLPIPPNAAWTQTLSNVAPIASTVLVVGTSQTAFGSIFLQYDLGQIGFNGCWLRVEPVLFFPATSSAGSFASVPMPVPGVTLRRRSMFTQWFVLDAGATNGVMAASQGLWHAFG